MLAGLAQLEFDILGLNTWWIGLTDQGHEGRYLEVEQQLVGRKGNLGETSNSVKVYFLPFQFLFNPYRYPFHF